jgi:hypothetical protein
VKAAKALTLAVFLAIFAVVLFFTFRSSPNVSGLSWMPERWGLWLDDHDEFRHFIGFAVFAAAGFMLNIDPWVSRSRSRIIRRLRSTRYRTGRLGAFLVLVYVLELGQLGMSHRDFDWLDVVNGWGGVILAWVVFFAYKSRHRRHRRMANERRHEAINVSTVRFR